MPRYSYGEEIVILSERGQDRLSLARSFANFAQKLVMPDGPWARNTEISETPPLVQKHIQNKKYDVFLSYSMADRDEARAMESFLTKKRLKVFLSEKDIKPGSKWEDEIKEALRNSNLLCMLVTPNSLRSDWIISEYGAAWSQDIRILPVLFQCSAKDLPEGLRNYQAVNFHEMSKIVQVASEQ